MRTLIHLSVIACVLSCSLLISCKTRKKSLTSTDTTSQSNKVTTAVVKSKVPNDSLSGEVPMPPKTVADAFKASYPAVENAVWEKLSKPDTKNPDYKAYFILNSKKHWIVYDVTGNLVETRVQILPDQLPHNIFSAIKKKYPGGQVVLATTYKNINSAGTYAAFVKPQANAQEVEVILLETGTFIK